MNMYYFGGSKDGQYDYGENFPDRYRSSKEWYTKYTLHGYTFYFVASTSLRDFLQKVLNNYAFKTSVGRLTVGGKYDGYWNQSDSSYKTEYLFDDLYIEIPKDMTVSLAVSKLLAAWMHK